MPNYAVTGSLGSGKTLLAVERAQYYLNRGRAVATNMNLKLENLINPFAKNTRVFRIPDIPTIQDLEAIGMAYEGKFKGDEHNGALLLEECALWLNARNFRDAGRMKIIEFLVHARKLRWDVYFIVQHVEMLDKQVRDAFCEHVIECKRTDRFKIPVISFIAKLFTGENAKLPKLHIGTVYYHGVKTDTIYYTGSDYYDSFNTEQRFAFTEQHVYSVCPPWHVYGRYTTKIKEFIKNVPNIPSYRFFLVGGLVGGLLYWAFQPDPFEVRKGNFTCNEAWEDIIGCDIDSHTLRKLIVQSKARKPKNNRSGQVGSDIEKSKHPLDDAVITASVQDGSQYIYSVSIDGVPVELFHMGYRLYDINACKARAVNMDDAKDAKMIYHADAFCDI